MTTQIVKRFGRLNTIQTIDSFMKAWEERIQAQREQEAQLAKKFPEILEGIESRNGAHFGAGWLPLVEGLLRGLTEALEEIPVEMRKHFQVAQIKEKFGGLRCYMVNSESERMTECIRIAEAASIKICDRCGNPATVRQIKNIMASRCDEHSTSY